MCGRFVLYDLSHFLQRLRQLELPFEEAPGFRSEPRWNIAPDTLIPTLLGTSGTATLTLARWGLIPHWAREFPKLRPINARAESAAQKPYFRDAFRHRRCLIPANGFYEWAKPQAKTAAGHGKQPYCISLQKGAPMAFAGLWERWQPPQPDQPPITTCTIITTASNNDMAPLHDRMPLILNPADWSAWLASDAAATNRLLTPLPDGTLTLYPVSPAVNNPRHEGRECMEPAGFDLR